MFQVVVQQWLIDDLNDSLQFKARFKKALEPYYTNVLIHSADGEHGFIDGQGGHSLVLEEIFYLDQDLNLFL